MKDRDYVKEVCGPLAAALLEELDRDANVDLYALAVAFYKEGVVDGVADALCADLLSLAKEEVEDPTPEAGPEEVGRPPEGGAAEEGVRGPAPLGEAPLDQGPEVEGVGSDLKEYTWEEHLRIYTTHGRILTYRDRYGVGGLPVGPGVALSPYDAEPILCAEILRLANEVRKRDFDLATISGQLASATHEARHNAFLMAGAARRIAELEEALRSARFTLAYGIDAGETMVSRTLRSIDQVLSSSGRSDGGDGAA